MRPYSKVSLSRLNSERTSLTATGTAESFWDRLDTNKSVTTRIDVLDTKMREVDTVHCRFFQEVRTNIQNNYLDISPEIAWVIAGHTENDVYSNTTWFVR